MTNESFDSGKERKELSPEEAIERKPSTEETEAYSDIRGALLRRYIIHEREHSESGGDDSIFIKRWLDEKGEKFEQIFRETALAEQDFVKRCNTDEDAILEMLEKKLAE